MIWWVVQCLYFAEYDLAFFKTRDEMIRHLRKCKLQHPPGDEIYRNNKGRNVSMFEVSPLPLSPFPPFAPQMQLNLWMVFA